jgi:hypothetical protein
MEENFPRWCLFKVFLKIEEYEKLEDVCFIEIISKSDYLRKLLNKEIEKIDMEGF